MVAVKEKVGVMEVGANREATLTAAEGREEERMLGWWDVSAGVGCAACKHRDDRKVEKMRNIRQKGSRHKGRYDMALIVKVGCPAVEGCVVASLACHEWLALGWELGSELPVGAVVEVEAMKSWDFSFLEGKLEAGNCPVRDGS